VLRSDDLYKEAVAVILKVEDPQRGSEGWKIIGEMKYNASIDGAEMEIRTSFVFGPEEHEEDVRREVHVGKHVIIWYNKDSPEQIHWSNPNIPADQGRNLLIFGGICFCLFISTMNVVLFSCHGRWCPCVTQPSPERAEVFAHAPNQPPGSEMLSAQVIRQPPRLSPRSLQQAMAQAKANAKEITHSSECPVCMDKSCDTLIVPCGHSGCHACIATIQGRAQACPICRGPIHAQIPNDIVTPMRTNSAGTIRAEPLPLPPTLPSSVVKNDEPPGPGL